jgi:predicted RNA-binding Zn ribbon-like protein
VIDFINTLDDRFKDGAPKELLIDYEDLLGFLHQSELLDARRLRMLLALKSSTAAHRALHSAKKLREALATILYTSSGQAMAPLVKALATLEKQVLSAHRQRHLTLLRAAGKPAQPVRAMWTWSAPRGAAALPVWILAQSAARLVTSDEINQVRACASKTCRWLFIDASKNHSRRWCDMKICGNRMKARRFSARRAPATRTQQCR